jgi:hypothetical protein
LSLARKKGFHCAHVISLKKCPYAMEIIEMAHPAPSQFLQEVMGKQKSRDLYVLMRNRTTQLQKRVVVREMEIRDAVEIKQQIKGKNFPPASASMLGLNRESKFVLNSF